MRWAALLHVVCSVAVAVGFAGCLKKPEVASPFTGTTRYLCCNLYYEKDKTSDLNPQVGTLVPFGTRVHVDRVRRDSVELTPEGFPPITLTYKYGDRSVPFETYLGE